MNKEIIQSSELLELIFENTHTLIAYLDKDMKFLRVNRAYATADGKDPDYFIGKGHFDLFPYEENEIIFHRVVETGESYFSYAKPFEYEHNPERGVTHWDWTLDPVKNKQGVVSSLILHLVDVSERIKAEEALIKKEQALQAINARVPGVVYQFKIDTKGKKSMLYVSPTVEKYTGLSVETVINNVDEWFALVHPDDLSALDISIAESMENMTVWDWEGRFIRKAGDVIWLHGTSTPKKSKDGSTIWDGIFLDISNRKMAEKEFERFFELSTDMVGTGNLEGYFTRINSSFKNILGYDREELFAKPFLDFVYEEDVERALSELQKAGQGKKDLLI